MICQENKTWQMATDIRKDIRKDTKSKICQNRQMASNSDQILIELSQNKGITLKQKTKKIQM
jgi:hypothetical protein